jgi:transposase
MKRFVEGTDRGQSTLFPAVLDDYVGEDNPVRAIDAFVDGLDLANLGFDGVAPLATGRPAYHPAPLLKIYIYGGPFNSEVQHAGSWRWRKPREVSDSRVSFWGAS